MLSRRHLAAFAILAALGVGSGIIATSELTAAFGESRCVIEKDGTLLSRPLMPGDRTGEVTFAIDCTGSGEFTLTSKLGGSDTLADAIKVNVMQGDEIVYRGPLPELNVRQSLEPGVTTIAIAGVLDIDYSAAGDISIELVANASGL